MAGTVFLYDWEAREGEQKIYTWKPTIAEPNGTRELTRLLIDFRQYVREKRNSCHRAITQLGQIRDKHLGQLLSLAYRASFKTEEGRSVKAKLVAPEEPSWVADLPSEDWTKEDRVKVLSHALFAMQVARTFPRSEDTDFYSYKFADPINLSDYKPIVKLAPTLSDRNGAITVGSYDDELCVTGLSLLGLQDGERHVLRMPRIWRPSAGLTVDILGPGQIRISEGGASFLQREDHIVSQTSIFSVEVVRKWLVEATLELKRTFRSMPASAGTGLFDLDVEDQPNTDVVIALWWIIGQTLSLGHGGALAIVPSLDHSCLTMRYPIEPLKLGEELQAAWSSVCNVWTSNSDPSADRLGAVENKRVAVHRWMMRLSSVARLTCADGCVVMDRQLTVHGFGGSIGTSSLGRIEGNCYDVAAQRDVPAESLLRGLGERHKSAFALCKQVDGVIAMVVSQDGDLRLFASDNGRILFADNLSLL